MTTADKPYHHSAARRFATSAVGEDRARTLASRKNLTEARLARRFTRSGREMAGRIESLRDIHRGERCVIMGNGPSLNRTDLGLLKNEVTFGLNRIYLMFETLGFSTTYLAVVNRHVVEQCHAEIAALPMPLFTTQKNADLLSRTKPPAITLRDVTGPYFGRELPLGIWQGATVTYVAMQVAYFMGFTEVVLVGVDHNFASKGPAHQLVESAGDDPNHFDPNYFGKGFKWQLPDLETSEIAYALARDTYEADGRRIVDATVGGKLQVFDKVDLAEALK